MIFESVHRAVLRRLKQAYGDLYTEQNVLITATHTHAGPGGYSHHLLYNTTTFGFHKATFEAVADGLFEAARNAHEDLAPSELLLSHGTLTGASVNRSRTAFDRNPKADRDHFPDAVDPSPRCCGWSGTAVPSGRSTGSRCTAPACPATTA